MVRRFYYWFNLFAWYTILCEMNSFRVLPHNYYNVNYRLQPSGTTVEFVILDTDILLHSDEFPQEAPRQREFINERLSQSRSAVCTSNSSGLNLITHWNIVTETLSSSVCGMNELEWKLL